MKSALLPLAALALLAGCAEHSRHGWQDSDPKNPYPAEEVRFCSSMIKLGGTWRPDTSPGPIAVVYASDGNSTGQRRAFCVFKGDSDPYLSAPPPSPNQSAPLLDLDSMHAQPPAPVITRPYWWEYLRGRWPIRLTHKIVAGSGATTIIVMVETLPSGYEQHRVVLVGEANTDGTPRATSVLISLFGSAQSSILLESAGPTDEYFVQTEIVNGVEVLKKYTLSADSAVKADVDAIKAAAAVANLDKAF